MLAEGEQADDRVPPTIQALLAARLDQLEPLERVVLERAAVVGKEFSRGAVVELSPADEHASIGATLLVARAQGARPPRARRALLGDDGFRFRHALIRDAAYAAIPKATRADLHERFARWLERARRRGRARRLPPRAGVPVPRRARRSRRRALAERAGELLGDAGRRAPRATTCRRRRTCSERALALRRADDERARAACAS